ncbi:MAG: hypothetical protein J5I93_03300 [Pirellulaceae bacterium]|nr:hypothetical protein [Pirellulaceae bacterium]
MSETTRLQCRCGQQFTAWLINGAPRSRCPYCKAPISEATPVEVAPPKPPDDLPPGFGSSVPPVRSPAAPVRLARPPVPSVPYRMAGWQAALVAGLVAGALGALAGAWQSPWVALLAGVAAAVTAAPLAGWLIPRITWRIPLALWARPCPRCHSDQIVRVHHTWWGGCLGTWLTHHVRCNACDCRFNGRSGEQDSYTIVTILAARIALLLILVALLLGVWMLTNGAGTLPTSPTSDDQQDVEMPSY